MLSIRSMPARRRHRRDFRPSLGDHFAGGLQFERRSLPQSSVFGAHPSMGVIGDLTGIDAGAQPLAGAQAGLVSVNLPAIVGTGMMPNQGGAGLSLGGLLPGGGEGTPASMTGNTFTRDSGTGVPPFGPLVDEVYGVGGIIEETTGLPTVNLTDTVTTAPITDNSSYISTEIQIAANPALDIPAGNFVTDGGPSPGSSSSVEVGANVTHTIWGAAVGLQAALTQQVSSGMNSGAAGGDNMSPPYAMVVATPLTWAVSPGSGSYSETLTINFTAPPGPNVGATAPNGVYIQSTGLDIGWAVSYSNDEYIGVLDVSNPSLPEIRQNPYGLPGQVIYQDTETGPSQSFKETFTVAAAGVLQIAYDSGLTTSAGLSGNETIPKEPPTAANLNWTFTVNG
jgi:hypothetical protein